MPKVQFYGGPYDGKEADLPFTPDLLIGETMDGDWGGGMMDFRVSTYVYQLDFPNGDNEPFEYRFRRDRPADLGEWISLPPKP